VHDGKLTRDQFQELKRRIAASPTPKIADLDEPANIRAARKLVEKFDAKNRLHRSKQYTAHTKAKEEARTALLFGTAKQALTAVTKFEGRRNA
jgi:hypothetical protein